MAVKIDALEIENVKRVKAVALEPASDGLTVIGGRNGQGKTSILDSIAWALGGDRRRPSKAKRDGAAGDPRLRVVLDNGIVVERKGKNASLKVTDPSGGKGGQALLDSFVEQLALDLPKFLSASEKEKADILLQIVGVGDELAALDREAEQLYNQRTAIGQMAKQKRGAADELPFHADAPAQPVSASELIQQQQEILARNGENQKKREHVSEIEAQLKEYETSRQHREARIKEIKWSLKDEQDKLDQLLAEIKQAESDLATARKSTEQLKDESTEEIEKSISEIDAINAKVRDNSARLAAQQEADDLQEQYTEMTHELNDVREKRTALLDGANLPLEGLSVEDGSLTFNGQKWDCISGSEQLRVATAIVRALKPECGFVLVDKTEQMDPQTLAEFGAWAQAEDLQVICTRVSTGDECSIVIEDGYAVGSMPEPHFADVNADDVTGADGANDGTADTEVSTTQAVFNFPGKE